MFASFIKYEIWKCQSHSCAATDQKYTKKCDVCEDYYNFDVFNAITVVKFPTGTWSKMFPLRVTGKQNTLLPLGPAN